MRYLQQVAYYTLFYRYIRTSNFGAEAECSYNFLRFEAENVLKVLNLHGLPHDRCDVIVCVSQNLALTNMSLRDLPPFKVELSLEIGEKNFTIELKQLTCISSRSLHVCLQLQCFHGVFAFLYLHEENVSTMKIRSVYHKRQDWQFLYKLINEESGRDCFTEDCVLFLNSFFQCF